MRTALVVFSGGQDSTTCLGWAIDEFDVVEAISFLYDQKHEVEVACAKLIIKKLEDDEGIKINHHIVDVAMLSQVSKSALVGHGKVTDMHPLKPGLPATYTPNRNALFFTMAHAMAQQIGAEHLVTGVCQTDYSGYPDCRQSFIDAIQEALNEGSESEITIHAPLMFMTKAQTFAMAEKHKVMKYVINYSHTCYNGVRSRLYAWGYGCGDCPACKLREKGWNSYVESFIN